MNGLTNKSFALLSPSGWGNLGDAAIVDAVIEQIRLRCPDASIIGLTLNPDDTLRRHNIPAMTLRGFSSIGYGNREPEPSAVSASISQALDRQAGSVPSSTRLNHQRRGMKLLLDLITRPLRRPLYPLKKEFKHLVRSYRRLKSIDLLIVCGGGQLDDYWGGAWGHPYVLFRWALLAKMTRTRMVILGVGTGTIQTALSRFFIRCSLRMAEFRSFRDAGSRDLVEAPRLVGRDMIGPDLAFALNVDRYLASKQASSSLHVAVSPMSYLDPRIWPEKDAVAYDRYVNLLADFLHYLVENKYRVSLFATDTADERTIVDVQKALSEKHPATAGAVTSPEIGTVSGLMTLLGGVDLVVASRLHGVLLSCLMETPTLALSYDRKVSALMRDLNLATFCGDLSTANLSGVIALFQTTAANRDRIRTSLRDAVPACRRQLEDQFDRVLCAVRVSQKVEA